METAFIVFICIIAYVVIGMFVGGIVYRVQEDSPTWHDSEFNGAMSGGLWPIAVPGFILFGCGLLLWNFMTRHSIPLTMRFAVNPVIRIIRKLS